MKSSQHKCPVCGVPLTVKISTGMIQLYCASGPCASHAANWGGHGDTEAEAYAALVKRVDAEQKKEQP